MGSNHKELNIDITYENSFEKMFILDTNVILNAVENIKRLSQEGRNIIVIPEYDNFCFPIEYAVYEILEQLKPQPFFKILGKYASS